MPILSSVALKEWAITCEALAQGRQILLLRKGGLLDEDGVFALEHRRFFLFPTWLHQDEVLVKPQHRDLFVQTEKLPGEGLKTTFFRHFAEVEAVWHFSEAEQPKLEAAPHIWSQNYLDLRFAGYKPDAPVLAAAVRVWELETPIRYDLRPEDGGCRSWIDLRSALKIKARPVLDGAEFGHRVEELKAIFR